MCDYSLQKNPTQVEIDDPKGISVLKDVLPPPPLVVLSIALQTFHNPHTRTNEVAILRTKERKLCVCCLRSFSFLIVFPQFLSQQARQFISLVADEHYISDVPHM